MLDSYRKTCKLPLLVEPNAGLPVLVDGKSVFPCRLRRWLILCP